MMLFGVLGPDAGTNLLIILLDASISSLIAILTVSLLMRWGTIHLPAQSAGLNVQIKVGVLVFLIEVLIMQFLVVNSFEISHWKTGLANALVLATLSGVGLYFLVLRPLEMATNKDQIVSSIQLDSPWMTNAVMFLILGLIVLLFLVLSYQQQFERMEDSTIASEQASQTILATIITEEIANLAADVVVFSDLQLTKRFLRKEDEASKRHLQNKFQLVSKHKPLYTQLRLLDATGAERIRIQRDPELGSITIEDEQLQDKSGRYYFHEGMAMGRGNFYISPLDLNIEHGKIEKPHRPMIRIAAPVFCGSERIGVVVANINAQHFIDTLAEFSASDQEQRWLLNSEGYWLYTPDAGKRWGFMFDARKSQTLARQQPEVWQRISAMEKGAFTTERGSYIVTRLDSNPNSAAGEKPHWFLVRHLSKSEISTQLGDMRKMMQFSYLAILGLLGLAAWFLTETLSEKRDAERRILDMAYHDGLTGLINRQRFISRLEQEISRSKRNTQNLAVMYMDLNNFKAVNDELGHEIGDMVLQRAGEIIASCFRDYDTIGRVGGDEFSAILTNYEGIDDLHEVARRIIDSFSAPLTIGGMDFKIGISIGIAQLSNYDEPVRHLLSRADFAMYEAKQSGEHAGFSLATESPS
jgi:diguanylate cyclase (GGDEF)-like protein